MYKIFVTYAIFNLGFHFDLHDILLCYMKFPLLKPESFGEFQIRQLHCIGHYYLKKTNKMKQAGKHHFLAGQTTER